jgi:hypothetical protein
MELEKKVPQEFGHLKKWIIDIIYSLKETDLWNSQNKMVPAGSGRYQEGRTGLRSGKKSKTKNIGRRKRLSTPVCTKCKC